MQQQQVRQFVERYLAAFSAHIVESHPDYITVKLPVEVDKDIGNRPFYWSWVEKMSLPYQPLVLTFAFQADKMPDGLRAEHLHLGAGRMQQIFASAKKHGRFLCMYENAASSIQGKRPSTPLVPWLGLNLKVSLLCDKKRDILLYLGVNLHEPCVVHDFTSFLFTLPLTPAIPDYHFNLDRRISLDQALDMARQEVASVLEREDQQWAVEARARLEEEWAILEAYYKEVALREQQPDASAEETPDESAPPQLPEESCAQTAPSPVEEPTSFDENKSGGGRILDFLRANGIQETPREQIDQGEWRKSTPDEERQRRMNELAWQYEPRIEVQLINGGLFYLRSAPPLARNSSTSGHRNPAWGRIL